MEARVRLETQYAVPPLFKLKHSIAPAVASVSSARQAGLICSPIQTALRLPLHRNHRHRSSPCRVQASSNITFHCNDTAITVPLSQDAAVGLSKAIEDVLTTFREKEKAVRPRRWESMEFRHMEDGVSVELFCNPNAHANPFQAKVLLTINDEKLKIVTEAQLSAIKTEVDQYLKAKV